MRLSAALRIASVLIIAKAILIGAVYWRRAAIIDPANGLMGWWGFLAIVSAGIAVAAVLCTACHR
jgi:hypothetical protein